MYHSYKKLSLKKGKKGAKNTDASRIEPKWILRIILFIILFQLK